MGAYLTTPSQATRAVQETAREPPKNPCEVRHCQAGRRRPACRVVRAMVSIKKGNVSKGVRAGKASREAGLQYNMQYAMRQNTITGARHARGGAVRGARGGAGPVVEGIGRATGCCRIFVAFVDLENKSHPPSVATKDPVEWTEDRGPHITCATCRKQGGHAWHVETR